MRQDVIRRLSELIGELDDAGFTVSAAYAQMAADTFRHELDHSGASPPFSQCN
jgi:hypothetical protein